MITLHPHSNNLAGYRDPVYPRSTNCFINVTEKTGFFWQHFSHKQMAIVLWFYNKVLQTLLDMSTATLNRLEMPGAPKTDEKHQNLFRIFKSSLTLQGKISLSWLPLISKIKRQTSYRAIVRHLYYVLSPNTRIFVSLSCWPAWM